jgi:hypothetical protein
MQMFFEHIEDGLDLRALSQEEELPERHEFLPLLVVRWREDEGCRSVPRGTRT